MNPFGTSRRTATRVAALLLGLLCALRASAEPGTIDDDFVYYFQRGDTLIHLGQRLLQQPDRWRDVQVRNGIGNPLRITPGTPLRIPHDWLRLTPYVATVGVVAGKVTRGTTPVRSGESLVEGSLIETAADGAVTLHLADGAVVTLQRSSRLGLRRLRKVDGIEATHSTRIELQTGRVETAVPPRRAPMSRFDVATPIAVSAVRGTQFRTSHGEAAGTSETLEGRVAVSNAVSAVAVAAGFGTRVERDAPPLAPQPLLPAPDLSRLAAVNSTPELAVALSPVAGAQRYRVQVAADASFQSIVEDRLTDTPAVSLPLADGNYWLRVRAIDVHGIEGLDAVKSLVQARAPDAPPLGLPASAARVTAPATTFEWQPVAAAEAYRLQVARDAGFTDLVLDEPSRTPSFAPGSRLPTGQYFWRVAASNRGGGEGPWSETRPFVQRPSPPVVNEPQFGRHDIKLSWPAESGGPWRVQVARDAAFERIVTDVVTTAPGMIIMRPLGGKWHVRAQVVDTDGNADPFGPVRSVQVPLPTWAQVVLSGAVLAPAL